MAAPKDHRLTLLLIQVTTVAVKGAKMFQMITSAVKGEKRFQMMNTAIAAVIHASAGINRRKRILSDLRGMGGAWPIDMAEDWVWTGGVGVVSPFG